MLGIFDLPTGVVILATNFLYYRKRGVNEKCRAKAVVPKVLNLLLMIHSTRTYFRFSCIILFTQQEIPATIHAS